MSAAESHDYPACAVFRGGLCTCDQPISLARSGALPRVPEASGVVPGVVTREEAGEGAPAPSPCVSEGAASAQRINRPGWVGASVFMDGRRIGYVRCDVAGCNYPEGDCLGVCS